MYGTVKTIFTGLLAFGLFAAFFAGQSFACSICFTGVNGGAKLNAYYMITILLTLLALGFMGTFYYVYRRYGAIEDERGKEQP